jgi:tetratricopeptide (TPR) repeat protein
MHMEVMKLGSKTYHTDDNYLTLKECAKVACNSPEILNICCEKFGFKTQIDNAFLEMLATDRSGIGLESLVLHLTRAFIIFKGTSHSLGKMLPFEFISTECLIGDIAALWSACSSEQMLWLFKCLQNECTSGRGQIMSCLDKGVCFHVCEDLERVAPIVHGETHEIDSPGDVHTLKALHLREMRWKFHTLYGSYDAIDEINSLYDPEGSNASNWNVKVALGSAFHRNGDVCTTLTSKNEAFQNAFLTRLDTLGELNPCTASSLKFLGMLYHSDQCYDSAIKFYERALSISMEVLGMHPFTASILSKLGQSYMMCEQDGVEMNAKAVNFFEQALDIFNNSVGKTHENAIEVISSLSLAYEQLRDYRKANDYAKEASEIVTKLMGDKILNKSTRKVYERLTHTGRLLAKQQDSLRHHFLTKSSTPSLSPLSAQVQKLVIKPERHKFSNSSVLPVSTRVQMKNKFYEGEWNHNFNPGRIFVGCDTAGAPEGRGVMTYDNGDRYEGIFKAGLPEGRGVMTYDNGDRYEGIFKAGLPEGRGVKIYHDGRRYEGNWKDGQKHGLGRLFSKPETLKSLIGFWREGHLNPEDLLSGIYQGEFQDGKMHGLGFMTYSSGSTYDGSWKNGQRCGDGTLVLSCGVYVGQFQNDKVHGSGKFTQLVDGLAFGAKHEGCQGDTYVGQWTDHYRNGNCEYTFGLTGNTFDFKWQHGSCPEFVAQQTIELNSISCGIGADITLHRETWQDNFGKTRCAGLYIGHVSHHKGGALDAGLQPGNRLLQVNAQIVTAGFDTMMMAARSLRGISGSFVNLLIEYWNQSKKNYNKRWLLVERKEYGLLRPSAPIISSPTESQRPERREKVKPAKEGRAVSNPFQLLESSQESYDENGKNMGISSAAASSVPIPTSSKVAVGGMIEFANGFETKQRSRGTIAHHHPSFRVIHFLMGCLPASVSLPAYEVPANFFVKKIAVISAIHAPKMLGLGRKRVEPQNVKYDYDTKSSLSKTYYPLNQLRIAAEGAETVLQYWMNCLFDNETIDENLTRRFDEIFYRPADCYSGVFQIELSESIGLNAFVHGVSMKLECVLMTDEHQNKKPSGDDLERIRIRMICTMAVWRAKRGICYLPLINSHIRFQFKEEEWLPILALLRKWAASYKLKKPEDFVEDVDSDAVTFGDGSSHEDFVEDMESAPAPAPAPSPAPAPAPAPALAPAPASKKTSSASAPAPAPASAPALAPASKKITSASAPAPASAPALPSAPASKKTSSASEKVYNSNVLAFCPNSRVLPDRLRAWLIHSLPTRV